MARLDKVSLAVNSAPPSESVRPAMNGMREGLFGEAGSGIERLPLLFDLLISLKETDLSFRTESVG